MIKARMGPVIFLGFDRGNIDRLLDNQPIVISGKEVLLPENIQIIILAGEAQQDIIEDLRAIGVSVASGG